MLPTGDAIWYGVPDLGIAPSFLHRYDRASQTAPGIAFPLGAVLAMCELPDGNIRYVTTDGDIQQIDDALQVTNLFDQDNGESLELNAASFSEDCNVIAAGDATSQSRIYAGFVEAIQPPEPGGFGPPFTPWRFRSRNGEPTVTASCILTPQEQANIVGFFAVMMRCDDGVETGCFLGETHLIQKTSNHEISPNRPPCRNRARKAGREAGSATQQSREGEILGDREWVIIDRRFSEQSHSARLPGAGRRLRRALG